ncbi:helix-turn-helix transcriptional regulator [Cereibacter sphaeroides f. sp. denitrificans]|nr:XRE family transcriptional regulator [Cereibacter sphaeroides f. sp. denitrificans]
MAKLSQFLTDHSITQRDFAARIGTSASYLSEIVSGRKTPGLELAFTIERVTGGNVPASSWLPGAASAAEPEQEQKGAA